LKAHRRGPTRSHGSVPMGKELWVISLSSGHYGHHAVLFFCTPVHRTANDINHRPVIGRRGNPAWLPTSGGHTGPPLPLRPRRPADWLSRPVPGMLVRRSVVAPCRTLLGAPILRELIVILIAHGSPAIQQAGNAFAPGFTGMQGALRTGRGMARHAPTMRLASAVPCAGLSRSSCRGWL
jgi:hypothetical protein